MNSWCWRGRGDANGDFEGGGAAVGFGGKEGGAQQFRARRGKALAVGRAVQQRAAPDPAGPLRRGWTTGASSISTAAGHAGSIW